MLKALIAFHCLSFLAAAEVNKPSERKCVEIVGVAGERPEVTSHGVSVPITGEDRYSTDLILKALGLPEVPRLGAEALVLTIGEGYSGLLPKLLESGLNAYGLDIWYSMDIPTATPPHIRKQMLAYQKDHGTNLITGSVFDLPFENNTVTLILSHMVLSHFMPQESSQALLEIVRVLKPGGEARIATLSQYVTAQIKPLLDRDQFPAAFTFVETGKKEIEIPAHLSLDAQTISQLQTMGYLHLIKN